MFLKIGSTHWSVQLQRATVDGPAELLHRAALLQSGRVAPLSHADSATELLSVSDYSTPLIFLSECSARCILVVGRYRCYKEFSENINEICKFVIMYVCMYVCM